MVTQMQDAKGVAMKGNRTPRTEMKKLQVWLPKEDYALLTKVAKHERLSYSSWTRRLIMQGLRRASKSLPDSGARE